MILQTQIANDDVVGTTTTYGTNRSASEAETVLDWLFPVYDLSFQVGALVAVAALWIVVQRVRRGKRDARAVD